MSKYDLNQLIEYIDPVTATYDEWLSVGMALKEEGYPASIWDSWSSRDAGRYKPGECYKKWAGFSGAASELVTAGTIVAMARRGGWKPTFEAKALDWDSVINDDKRVIDPDWLEPKEFHEPADADWDPMADLTTYISTLFEGSDYVGYVMGSWEKDGRYMPKKGNYDRTAGELLDALGKCNGDIGSVLGDYDEKAGAWIRFNPLDGQGVKNSNVAAYRYALVESDNMDLERQYAIMRELELPIACLVYSGSKSLHAIVKTDADTYDEYRRRVNYLYDVCSKNGLDVDSANRNPSRLSRLPGVRRGAHKQFLISTNTGKKTWMEWEDWIEGINDNLPEPESLEAVWDDMPELAPPLIESVLRQGHKLLLAGPSKAGKSFLLMQLVIAIAEGSTWMGWQCAQGRVLYVNLELDRASCLHRFRDVYDALAIKPKNLDKIDIWNLRGKSVPMDKLAPKLIRRAQKREYIAVVIDPIYKVITGDENSADQMAHFCNQFDRICSELGSSVIYCHHHSKGFQGAKRSMDRASGSGVFARDPDALLDLIELDLSRELKGIVAAKAKADAYMQLINTYNPDYADIDVKDYDLNSAKAMREHAERALERSLLPLIDEVENKANRELSLRTAWRIEGTLREFPSFTPVNCWFEYPIHKRDVLGLLDSAMPDFEKPPNQRASDGRKTLEENKQERFLKLQSAFSWCAGANGTCAVSELAEYMKMAERTVKRYIKESDYLETYQPEPGMALLVRRLPDDN
ncbi:MAG: AAA family ATPase [Eubacteriales bacterium]|nr:AAA family ATPase [Eubacteriales bacterium]